MTDGAQGDDASPGTELALRVIAEGPEADRALLVLDAPSRREARDFFNSFTDMMFPPGERSESVLSISSNPPGYFFYEVRSSLGVADVSLAGVTPETARLVETTLNTMGSIAIAFGSSAGGSLALLDPTSCCLYRRYGAVDGKTITGGSPAKDWTPFLEQVKEQLETFE